MNAALLGERKGFPPNWCSSRQIPSAETLPRVGWHLLLQLTCHVDDEMQILFLQPMNAIAFDERRRRSNAPIHYFDYDTVQYNCFPLIFRCVANNTRRATPTSQDLVHHSHSSTGKISHTIPLPTNASL